MLTPHVDPVEGYSRDTQAAEELREATVPSVRSRNEASNLLSLPDEFVGFSIVLASVVDPIFAVWQMRRSPHPSTLLQSSWRRSRADIMMKAA